MSFGFWKYNYRLDKMGLKDLWVAYFMHYTIQAYLVLAAFSSYFAFKSFLSITPVILSIVSAIILYPFAWYLLHRYVLHGRFLYRSLLTARMWKRIHFDHHRDPHDLNVLFGALNTTLPTIIVVTMPIGWLIGNEAGLWSAFTAGLLITCFYEFNHCIQHLNYTPQWKFLQEIKKLHLRHHFYDEKANFGITNFIPDQVFKTFHPAIKGRKKSDTVFNLGYTGEEVQQYPWVARLTDDIDEEHAITHGVERRKVKQDTA